MKTTIADEDILIRAQETPNPYALKFVVNQPLKRQGKATFHAKVECGNLPLAASLFDIAGVKQVYFSANTLTITHDGILPQEDLIEQVSSVIQTRLAVHDPDFFVEEELKKTMAPKDRHHDSEELNRIEEILDRTIRPGLQSDGGDIEVISLENNELKIIYQGACGGCPSSMMGTLDAIQGILRYELENADLLIIPV